jgi:protocatechuate 3,4-dioxygenase beta subunit
MKRVLLFSLLLVGFALGQTPTGTIKGTVLDSQGAAVSGAVVKAVNNSTGLTKQTTTDSAGRFELPFLNPASYTITAEASGFRMA